MISQQRVLFRMWCHYNYPGLLWNSSTHCHKFVAIPCQLGRLKIIPLGFFVVCISASTLSRCSRIAFCFLGRSVMIISVPQSCNAPQGHKHGGGRRGSEAGFLLECFRGLWCWTRGFHFWNENMIYRYSRWKCETIHLLWSPKKKVPRHSTSQWLFSVRLHYKCELDAAASRWARGAQDARPNRCCPQPDCNMLRISQSRGHSLRRKEESHQYA